MADRIWKDKQGRIALYQRPNIWLIAWAVLDVAAIFTPSKRIAHVTRLAAAAVLIIWSLLEIFRGVNYFRRALGLGVLLLTMTAYLSLLANFWRSF